MEILKILNNNVVVTKDENGKEIIAMGKGIAFKKKNGDHLDKDQVDKVYMLTSDVANKFQELLSEIPLEFLETSTKIIDFIKIRSGKKLNENLYISLTDHIFTTIKRYQQGIKVKNMLLWDIQKFYKEEYEIGVEIIDMIKTDLGIELEYDEAGFIALHIVNAEMDERIEDIYEVTKLMQEIVKLVKYYFHVDFDESSIYYYRFITHLKFFALRLVTKKNYNDEYDDTLLDIIKNKYENSYKCCLKIKEFLKNSYEYDLSNEEMLYLTIHISRVIYKNKANS